VAIDCNISIIIVSFNCLGPLKDCLNSIKAQGNVNFETIIVDNDSQDGTPDFLKDQKDVRAVFPGKNIGFGAAVNLAAKQARGQYLFILNPDTLLPSNCLASLLEFANSHPDSGLIAPILSHTDGSYQISARKFPRRCDLIFGRGSPLFKLGLVREKDAGYYSSIGEGPLQVPAVSLCILRISTYAGGSRSAPCRFGYCHPSRLLMPGVNPPQPGLILPCFTIIFQFTNTLKNITLSNGIIISVWARR
jgi:glycosyltransferase involved in cell wall biosynthesis